MRHAAGLHTVGVCERIGRHLAHGNRWRDVILTERRNPLTDQLASMAETIVGHEPPT